MITTGGTIGGHVAHDGLFTPAQVAAERTAGLCPDADELNRFIAPTRANLSAQLNTEIDIEPLQLMSMDSSNADSSLWDALTREIEARYDDFDSFLITHGTSTLGYTCAALSFSIANSSKPIVLTGSQVPFNLPGSDALTNLENALRVCLGQGQGNTPISGVVAVFGSFIITGTRVKKDTEFDYDAIKSFGTGVLGRIGRIINIDHANLQKHNSYLATNRYPLATQRRHLRTNPGFDMNIASLTEFPGMDPDIFEILVEQKGVKGLILRAFGAGDPASRLRPAFEMLKGRRIPIVVTTQAPNGNSNFQVNEPGQWLRDNDMAVPAFDMSIEAQTTKLAWLLHRNSVRHHTYTQICEKMQEDLRGEITVMWEIS
jgi:L-asparaginase